MKLNEIFSSELAPLWVQPHLNKIASFPNLSHCLGCVDNNTQKWKKNRKSLMSSGRLEIDAGEDLVQVVLPDHNVCANQINGESSTMIQVACQNTSTPPPDGHL